MLHYTLYLNIKKKFDCIFFPETCVPVINIETGARLIGEQAPKVKNLGQWLSAHPKYVLDIPSSTSSVVPAISQATSSKSAEKSDIKSMSAISDKITSKREIGKDTHSKVFSH